tara:strand:- start:496 stop:675 length:180 start_codon:yes stop_codon:yes gene_type:complete
MKSYKQMMSASKKSLESKRKNYALTRLQDDMIRIRRQLDLIDRFIEDFIDDKDKYLTEK